MSFMEVIRNCVREFQRVGHLFVLEKQEYAGYLNIYLSGENDLSKRLAELMSSPRSRDFYTAVKPYAAYTSPGNISSNKDVIIEDLQAISNAITTGVVGDGIPYLKITSFSAPVGSIEQEKLYNKLSQYFSSIAEKGHLIIDVRGNGGGNDGVWLFGIVPFLEQTTLKRDEFMGTKSGSLNLAIDPIIADSKGRYGTRYTDNSWQSDFPYIQPKSVEGVDIFLKSRQIIPQDTSQKYFSGKVWVLIDNGCYSATDAFTSFCRETGFATLVGSTTGGNGKGANPHLMALPYSGLLIRYDAYLSFNIDGTCNGITGTPPDIPCIEGMDALETCLQAIQQEAS